MTFRYGAIQLYDLGFGPRLLPVTPPGCDLSPSSTIKPKDRGKAPGQLTPSGWIEQSVYRRGCPDYATAKTWQELWGANVGFAVGDGYVILDNDQGREFSAVLMALLKLPLRRFVMDAKHERDAFIVRVLDFIGEGANVDNNEQLIFRNGTRVAKLSVLARGKQAVIAGVHPGTGAPYAWSRELTGLEHIPTMSENEFEATIRNFVVEVGELGWVLERQRPVSAPVSAPPVAIAAPGHNHPPESKLDEARSLLEEIPNRDTPPNITRSNVDEWLDDYTNWISVAYALIAFLGALAHTPEAQDLWITWSDGRSQAGQTSESVWRSALQQPTRFGDIGLVKLVRSLVRPTSDFPDIDPDDEMLAPDPTIWETLKARWAYCPIQSGFVDMLTGDVIGRQAFADKYAYLARRFGDELGVPRKNRPNAAGLFLTRPDRQEVRNLTYAPGDPTLIPDVSGAPLFNNWRATTALRNPVDPAQIKPWLKHVEIVLGAKEVQRFLRWCAFIAQYPELKPNWHYIVISDQGLGKDTLVSPLKVAVGDGNWHALLSFALARAFDYALEHKLLIVGETAQPKSGLINAHDFNTILKPLLAQPPTHLTVNLKYRAPYEIPNRCALIMFSNDPQPLLLERGQRRVHVVNRLAQPNQDPDYYDRLHQWLDNGGAALVASYLLTYPLVDTREFVGGVAPETDDKIELENQSIHPQLAALEELIADAREGVKDGTPYALVATADDLVQMIKGKGCLHPTSQSVQTWLMDMERRKIGVRRFRVNPKEPNRCAIVNTHVQGQLYSGRLWLLADKAPDGRLWSALTLTEIIALWKNLASPSNATVIKHPSAKFPDDDAGEEPV